ncbi:MAG: histidine phosphatase family protein [Marinobacter sp.]|uniref:histidine phosphatase family protein n=1 Tax=Marinobacter sp. TaxID=50741 RepID=UPI00299F16FE|nr:histidine phosphatase family protein [Marinobacter sp.]MDX1754524.1 histidine phosphatase family protein [Marinobacter sp.]
MATIYLIRHGQASFGKDNYDELSQMGWKQGRVLGRWLAGKVRPQAVLGGSLERHRETAEAIASGYGSAMPDMQILPGLNEFDHGSVIEAFRPAWADRAVMARDLSAFPKPAKAFQEAFVQAVRRWASGQHDEDYRETWPEFRLRVLAALDQLIEFADGSDVLVVTSGGPISVIVQQLLGLTDEKALKLNEVIANTSVTRVLYSGARRSLSVFNNYSHLEAADPALVTFR